MALTLFKNITSKLTDFEKEKLAPMLIDVLKDTHTDRRITSKKITEWFLAAGFYVSGPRIRKMVNYIRVMNLCSPAVLIGASTGYFITTRIGTVDLEIESMVGRIESQLAVVDAFRSQRENLKRNQYVTD